MNSATLPRHITNQLLHLAQVSPEQEICGLIGSKDGIAISHYPINNTDKQPEQRFQLEPGEQISAMKAMREKGEQLFAIYHSHPHAPAVPSALDLQQAAYPEALYLIISLNTKGVLEIRGYQIQQQKAEEIPLQLG